MTEHVVPAAIEQERGDSAHQKVVRKKHWGRHISAVITAIILGGILFSLFTNPNLEWDIVLHYIWDPRILDGVGVTLILSAVSMVIGVVGAVILAIMRISDNRLLRVVSSLYIWFFRGTPLLVQIIFWGFLGALYPVISLGIIGTDITLFSFQTNVLIGPFVAALLALSLNEAAYSSEVVRSGLLSVDVGQREAASSLGMSPMMTMRLIVLPQAIRIILPPMGNQTITMLKMTSLVSVIAGTDLLTNIQSIYSQTFEIMPLLVVASLWYLFLTSLLSIGQHFIERKYGQGVRVSVS